MGFVTYPVGDDGTTLQLGGPGLALIASQTFSAVSSVSVNNCFTGAYEDYRIMVRITNVTLDGYVNAKLRLAGSDASTNYSTAMPGLTAANAANGTYASAVAFWYWSEFDAAVVYASMSIDLFSPALATPTNFTISNSYGRGLDGAISGNGGGGYHSTATAYDGLTLIASAGAMTGKVTIYGYQKG